MQVGGENFLLLRRMPAKIKKLRKERMGQRERESYRRRFATRERESYRRRFATVLSQTFRHKRERVLSQTFRHSPYFDGPGTIVRLLVSSSVLCSRKQPRARVCVSYKQRDTARCQGGTLECWVCARARVCCMSRERGREREKERGREIESAREREKENN